jgi:LemA protein
MAKMAKKMTWLIPVVVIGILIVMFLGWLVSSYNMLVSSQVSVDTAWSQVETAYQRRADLIPNLVETVKGAKNFEQQTLVQITQARSAWTNAKTPEDQVAAANGMESALSRLMVVVENYPDLKSNQNFLALQDELANTENKIAVERGRYNQAVQVYNTKVRSIPTNMVAGIFGFGPRTFFKATAGSDVAPKVGFE